MKHQIYVWQQELCTFPKYSPHPESEEKKTKTGSFRSLKKEKIVLVPQVRWCYLSTLKHACEPHWACKVSKYTPHCFNSVIQSYWACKANHKSDVRIMMQKFYFGENQIIPEDTWDTWYKFSALNTKYAQTFGKLPDRFSISPRLEIYTKILIFSVSYRQYVHSGVFWLLIW